MPGMPPRTRSFFPLSAPRHHRGASHIRPAPVRIGSLGHDRAFAAEISSVSARTSPGLDEIPESPVIGRSSSFRLRSLPSGDPFKITTGARTVFGKSPFERCCCERNRSSDFVPVVPRYLMVERRNWNTGIAES